MEQDSLNSNAHTHSYIHQIVKETGAPKHRCAEYMNALVHSKDVLKIARKVRS
jgi:hypothetical protein